MNGIYSGIRANVMATVGHTPVIRLAQLSDATGCEILSKAEFMNPGGSVKDRTALGLIEDAKRNGALQPGGTIVEGIRISPNPPNPVNPVHPVSLPGLA